MRIELMNGVTEVEDILRFIVTCPSAPTRIDWGALRGDWPANWVAHLAFGSQGSPDHLALYRQIEADREQIVAVIAGYVFTAEAYRKTVPPDRARKVNDDQRVAVRGSDALQRAGLLGPDGVLFGGISIASGIASRVEQALNEYLQQGGAQTA